MKLVKLLFFVLFPMAGFSQIGGEDEVYLNGDRIEAKFNGGGIDECSKFIRQEFDYSKVTKAGKMVGAFTVDVDGSVKGIKIIEFFDVNAATEFIRVLKKCPKWEPAKRGGKPISKEESPLTVIPMKEDNASDPIYNTAGVEKKPEFPGGLKEFYDFIGKTFKAPDVKGLSGKIFATFVVEKDGSLTDIKVIRDIGYGTAEETIRVLKLCPKWIPGEQKGRKVRVMYSLPISIQAKK